jgi:squalene synthase HpnC
MTPKEAFDYCENMAKSHYENFPVGFIVPGKLQKHVYAIYAFARFADDLADDERLPVEERKSALDAWSHMLNECYSGNTEHPIYIALKETIDKFNIPKQLLEDLLIAFKMDLNKTRYNNFDEILYYCKHSANPVGRLILTLFEKNNDETYKYSDSICTGLQIANFLQDVNPDILKDRIYFPLDSFSKFKYSEEDFLNKKNNAAFINIFETQIKRTEELFDHGENLIKHLNGRLKLEIILTLEGGRAILKKAEIYKSKIFDKRPKINTFDKLILFIKTIIKWILM